MGEGNGGEEIHPCPQPTFCVLMHEPMSISLTYLHDSAAKSTALHYSIICCHQMAFLPEMQIELKGKRKHRKVIAE